MTSGEVASVFQGFGCEAVGCDGASAFLDWVALGFWVVGDLEGFVSRVRGLR
jgi:hypothetical protein